MQRQISFMVLVNLQSGASVQMLLFIIKKLRKWKCGCNSAAHREMEPCLKPLPQVLIMFAVKTSETIILRLQPKCLGLSLNVEL